MGASKEVLWYDKRNQVLRNLNCAVTYAQQEEVQHYFVIMVVEKDLVEQNPTTTPALYPNVTINFVSHDCRF